MTSRTLEILRNSIKWLLVAVAVTPLIYISGMYYPFIVPKVVYFRTLVELSLALFAIYAVYKWDDLNISVFKRKIVWLPAIFLGASYLSSYFGIDFYYSFWSTFERMDGLFTLTHLVAYFYLVIAFFKEKDWKHFFLANAVVGSLVALYAVGQHFGLAWFLDKADPRVKGTIGNPAFLASYLAMTIFFVYELAKNTQASFMRYVWSSLFLIHILAIIWSQTRGIFVALLVGTVALFVFFVFTSRNRKTKTLAVVALALLVLAGSVFYAYREEIASTEIPMLSRVASISTKDATTQSRLFVWGESIKASQERPLLGYGFENLGYVYNKFYDPQRIGEEWFDRSHNVYIDALIHGGATGLLAYLAMIFFMFYALWRYRIKDNEKAVLLGLLLVVYAVQNFFVFDTINTSFLFWALLAFIIFLSAEQGVAPKKTAVIQGTSVLKKYTVFVLAGGVVLSGYWTNFLPVRTNVALYEGYMYQIADIKRSVAALERGLSYGTYGDLGYGYQVYDMYKNKLEYGKISQRELNESYEFSVAFLEDLIEKYPWNVRLYIYWGHVVEGRPKGVSYDEKKFADIMEKAMKLSPKRPQAYYLMANIHLNKLAESTPLQKKELNTKALEVLKRYADLVPHYAEAQFIVANVADKAGDRLQAEEYFKRGDSVYIGDYSLAKRAVGYLIRTNDYSRAEKYLKDISDFDQSNLDAMTDLAKVYYMNGKIDEAVETLNKVNEINPEFLEKEPELVSTIYNSYKR